MRAIMSRWLLLGLWTAALAFWPLVEQAAGQPAVTVQLPTFGVAIDAQGVLAVKIFEDPTGRLAAVRREAAKAQLPKNLQARSPIRKVSLVRLEAAVQAQLAAGKTLDDATRYLAGLQRLQYVFFLPDAKDIVIAGPAEGFAADASGRVVGLGTGRPVIELDDLVAALRAYASRGPAEGFVGCTIDPAPEAMARLQKFQRTVPHAVAGAEQVEVGLKIAEGMQIALGLAPIRVFDVSPKSHLAQVLIEADYRMKLIGLGLERPPVRFASYFELLSGANIRASTLQRWWFTPNYECVKVSDDGLAMELVGEGLQLLTESKLIGPDGRLKSGAPGNRASDTFTAGFTRKYAEMAQRVPVYAQLRNEVDLLVAAAFLRQQGYAHRAGWKMPVFGNETVMPVQTCPVPKQAPAAVNAAWRGSRFVAAAGGGVSIRPEEALTSQHVQSDKDGKVAKLRSQVGTTLPAERWWWD
ncbi:MAG: DUF1598 domain-containing protein [Thermoguttaceae bacterium]